VLAGSIRQGSGQVHPDWRAIGEAGGVRKGVLAFDHPKTLSRIKMTCIAPASFTATQTTRFMVLGITFFQKSANLSFSSPTRAW
jgi:hypothetical protein